MTAIVTNRYKRFILDFFQDDFDSADNRYYIGLGKSDEWNNTDTSPVFLANDELSSLARARSTRLGLQSGKVVNNFSFVVPRFNWIANTIYPAFDDLVGDFTTNGYYVLTDENQVYICIEQGKDGGGDATRSTVKPTGTTNFPTTLADGYTWKFMYTISAADTSKYVTSQFIPAFFFDSATVADPATQQQQKVVQDFALANHPKSIVNLQITNNGNGSYPPSTTQSVEIRGNGTGAAATATIDANGNMIKITLDDSTNTDKKMGKDYDYAEAIIAGGGTGSARVIISPPSGISGNPLEDLRGISVMLNAKFEGDENDTILAANDFRQIALLRNPKNAAGADFSGTSGLFLKKLSVSNVTGGVFQPDDVIESTSGSPQAKAWVDFFDTTNDQIWYHQNDSTGFADFQGSQSLTNNQGVTAITLGSNFDSAAEIDPFSGDLLYIDNRTSVDRSTEQTEDVKIVIRL